MEERQRERIGESKFKFESAGIIADSKGAKPLLEARLLCLLREREAAEETCHSDAKTQHIYFVMHINIHLI